MLYVAHETDARRAHDRSNSHRRSRLDRDDRLLRLDVAPVTKYRVLIEAELEAKNFESAQKKCADLEQRVKRAKVHASHVELRGEKR